MRSPPYRLPEPGDMVGQYRVVAPVGRGGQGHVYKAECTGRFFVLKFFESRLESPWGELEIDILRHLEHPNVVRVLGYGWWPDPERGFLYIVMEYVEGLPLEEHALEHNPSARRAATLLMKAARALGVVHRRRVLHRDVKPDNLMVRAVDGEPVWVDFGVGHLEGRTTLPGQRRLPPGTPEFISPEAYRFLQEHSEEQVRYQPGVTDEVWAFGVTSYWLLTDEWPFGERNTNPQMVEHIRTRTPRAPHESNPRVPVVLSQVCMRMLETEPGARYADMDGVAEALEAALAGAGEDASWEAPLLDPDAPERRTTEEIPGKVVDRDTWERFIQEYKAVRPRRGRVRKAAGAQPAAHVHGADAAPREPAAPVPGPVRRALPSFLLGLSGVMPIRAGAVAVAVVVVLAIIWAVQSRTVSTPAPAPAPVEPLPPGLLASNPTLHAYLVRELAVSREQSEAGGSAVLFVAPTPAPLFTTMLRKEDSRLKKEEKPAPRPQRGAAGCVPTTQETCVVGICTLLLTGCTATPQVVRPPPKPADCPPGAVETMTEELGIKIGKRAGISFVHVGGSKPLIVRESSRVGLTDDLGKLRAGSELFGRFYLGAERVYGRFTQARTPDGKTYPVCLELLQYDTRTRGAARDDVGGPADVAVVFSSQDVRAVDHFE
ncbi:serine/threonine-protein kinase [Archangium sp.]|uniref:serine/threonine protein kinase n=1 Tax=Archangium sp. TaxID=1872627 RepID=UPI002D71639D|nr:serine/threonine-protein kinase [Archangium sp.]HYO54328.1 serine/threonine-protein kinase [Archangium sp.]